MEQKLKKRSNENRRLVLNIRAIELKHWFLDY